MLKVPRFIVLEEVNQSALARANRADDDQRLLHVAGTATCATAFVFFCGLELF
jgi:hypothetical protein